MQKKVQIEKKHLILNDFFKVEEALLSFERFDGSMSPTVRRLNFERGDSVAALLYDVNKKAVVLVNQFKYPTYAKGPGWITEVVAGMVDKGETPEEAVRREIMEEAGYAVEKLEHISTFYVSPGGSSERVSLFFAEVSARPGGGGGLAAESENIQVLELPPEEAFRQAACGEIVDAKTIVSLYWMQNRY